MTSSTITVVTLFFAIHSAFPPRPTPETAVSPVPPKTEKIPVTDVYLGVSVVDDYRWLENGADPKVKAWVADQNAYTQAYVSKLPQREAVVSFLKKVRQESHIQYGYYQYAGGLLFALKFDPEKSGASLVVVRSPED
ncbi:MAG: hypothetical protein WA869_01160, partial [Alloacidobacterium sp.]